MITGHVPAARLPPDHADGRMAAAVPARGEVKAAEFLFLFLFLRPVPVLAATGSRIVDLGLVPGEDGGVSSTAGCT
jgi:hypothetical protein